MSRFGSNRVMEPQAAILGPRQPGRLEHGHAFFEKGARQISRALIALLTASDFVWTWSLS